MKLLHVVESEDQLKEYAKETVLNCYTKKADGRYYLDIDEDQEKKVLKTKVDEFRIENIDKRKLTEEQEKIIKKLKEEVEQTKTVEGKKAEEMAKQMSEKAIKDRDSQIEALQKANDETVKKFESANLSLANKLINEELIKAARKMKGALRVNAEKDIVNRGREIFQLIEGEPKPIQDGKLLYGKDGKSTLTPEEFIEGIYKDCPYYWEGSQGSGASGNNSGGKGTAIDWSKIPTDEKLAVFRKHNK